MNEELEFFDLVSEILVVLKDLEVLLSEAMTLRTRKLRQNFATQKTQPPAQTVHKPDGGVVVVLEQSNKVPKMRVLALEELLCFISFALHLNRLC